MPKTLATDTVANKFASFNNVIILDGIGDKNVDGVAATTYTAFIPESCLEYLKEFKQWVNNNWAKLVKEHNGSVAELLADLPNIAASFEPSDPKAQTPLKLAVQNILCRMNPLAVQGLAGAALVKACAPDVEIFLVKASLEKYNAQLESELIAIQNATDKRSVKGEKKTAETGGRFTYETADETETATD